MHTVEKHKNIYRTIAKRLLKINLSILPRLKTFLFLLQGILCENNRMNAKVFSTFVFLK